MKKLENITKEDLEKFIIKFHSFSPDAWTPPKLLKYEIDIDSKQEPTIYLSFIQTNFLENKDMEVSGSLKFGDEPLTCFLWVTLVGNRRDSIDRFTLPKLKFWHDLGYDILQLEQGRGFLAAA